MTGHVGEAVATTWLFVPGDRPDRFGKAAGSGADEVICDLEDAVAEDRKDEARRQVARWLAEGGRAWVRVNASPTPYYEADVAAVVGLAGLRGIVVPKAEDPAALADLGRRLRPGTGILALVETAAGVLAVPAIARCPAVSRLAFGSVDFAADIGATNDEQALLTARSMLVYASRAAGKPAPVDSATIVLDRPEIAAQHAIRARQLGFGGKLCIHPAQVRAVAEAFRPTEAEVAWAREIVAAAERTGAGAGRARGQMIDKPVIDQARRILAGAAPTVTSPVARSVPSTPPGPAASPGPATASSDPSTPSGQAASPGPSTPPGPSASTGPSTPPGPATPPGPPASPSPAAASPAPSTPSGPATPPIPTAFSVPAASLVSAASPVPAARPGLATRPTPAASAPLAGLVVVTLEQAVAAPFATRQLADLGARVIKIERPGVGDFARGYDRSVLGQASYFVWLNRGKESVELDVKSDQGRAALAALLRRADVFVQNLAPGAAERLGLGASELLARHPRLICCSVSGYGPNGPYASKKAYDLLVQCEAGLLSITGTPDAACKAGISVADIAAGMYAYSGVLTALYERERTGRGSTLEVSLLDALGEWMSQPYYYTVYGKHDARRTGARHASISPYGPYLSGQVFLGLQNDREWAVLCERVLDRPDLITDERFATNPDRVAHDDELTPIIEAALGHMTPDEVVARLDAAGIASARLRTPADFAAHPQLAARERWREVDTPAGPVRALLPPVTVPGREAAMGAVPALGQHTEAVLAELESQ